MANDTPPTEPDESQDSFMSERNAARTHSVETGMDDTTPTPAEVDANEAIAIAIDGAPDTGDREAVHAFDPTETSRDESPMATPSRLDDDSESGGSDADASTKPFEPDVAIMPVEVPSGTPPPKDRSLLIYALIAVVAGIVGGLLTVGVLTATGTFDTDTPSPSASTRTTVTSAPAVTQITNDIGSAVNPTAIAAKVLPSVVTVNVFSGADAATRIPTGSGSGVVMSADGFIITNHHVIDSADSFDVSFEDGRTYSAELVGSDSLTDLAVLQISADNLIPIEFGSADGLAVGDPAVAVGNPLGQDGGSSITAGIISAFGRRVDFADSTSLFGMIQTDAAINSGSSGGALVDAEGRLIGITSAIGVSTAGPEGIGYAIPIELVDRITAEIIETGDVVHPFLGVTIQTTFDTAPDGATVPAGASIESIEGADSAAGAAGLEAGDVIVSIGGDTITSQSDLILEVRLYRVGDVVPFTVERGGERLSFDVTMGQRPPEFQG